MVYGYYRIIYDAFLLLYSEYAHTHQIRYANYDEIEISDGDGDLFEIIDTGYYIKFKPDRGIARYVKGILVVNGQDWRFYEEE